MSVLRVIITISMTTIYQEVIASNSSEQMSELATTLLKDYVPYVRPEHRVTVNVTFKVSVLKGLSEVNGQLSLIGFPTMHWNDSRLSWRGTSNFNDIQHMFFPSSEIWHPAVQLINSAESLMYLHQQESLIRCDDSGFCTWSPSNSFDVLCNVDVRNYPFDEHTCNLTFLSWNVPRQNIGFRIVNKEVLWPRYQANHHWKVVGEDIYSVTMEGKTGFEISIRIQRRSKFVVVNLVVPILLLVLSNVMVFVLPGDSGERVGFSITILLAISVFMTMISAVLPPTSFPDIPIISYLLMLMYMVSLIILVQVIVGLRFYTVGQDEPIPHWLVVATRLVTCQIRRRPETVEDDAPDDVIGEHKKRKLTNHSVRSIQVVPKGQTSEVRRPSQVTWKQVGKAFDRLCIIFSLAVIGISAWTILLVIG